MTHEVFISYASQDKAAADAACAALEAQGVRCWIAPRDIRPGVDWSEAIIDAIDVAKVFLLVFSSHADASQQVKREVQHAFGRNIPVIPMRIEMVSPSKSLQYYLSSPHWLDALTPPLRKHLNYLSEVVRSTLDGAPLTEGEASVPAPRPRALGRLGLALGTLVVLLSAATAAWLFWPARHWTVESSRSFISTPALEGEPAFSRDGKTLAYSSGADLSSRKIYVRNVAGGDGVKVTSDPYDDVSPSWSSDGARIAYVAQKVGEPCRIMVATVPAGAMREVARCREAQSSSVSWQAGTSFLYYLDRSGASGAFVMRLDLETGARLQLPRKAGLIPEIFHLQCAPDGRSLLYVRNETASTDAIVVRDLSSGDEKTLGRIVGSGSAAWSEDSRAILTSRASGIGSEITALPVRGGTPYRLYSTTINVGDLAAGTGGMLALETDASRQSLARASLAPAAQPDIIHPTNGKTWAPTFAPDGTLAFLSNRSGSNAIWVIKPGTTPRVLFDAGLAPLFRLEFSPDGSRLAAVIAGEKGLTIKILTADGGATASFDTPTVGYAYPAWTPDSKAVLLYDRRVAKLVRVAIDDPARRTPYASAPPWEAVVISQNGTFALKLGVGGIIRRLDQTPTLTAERKISERLRPADCFPRRRDSDPGLQCARGPAYPGPAGGRGPRPVARLRPGHGRASPVLREQDGGEPENGRGRLCRLGAG